MKLSVSTSGWREMGWPEYENLARELKYSGIELHDALNPEFADMVRMCEDASRLELQGVGISCVDALGNPASGDAREACVNELKQLCELAKSLKCPFVRLRAQDTDDDIQTQGGNVRSVIDAVISGFSASGVTLLVETAGIFSDTERLKNLLDEYALDCLQALWDVHNTFRFSGETPERSITNLGAYVKHVHIKDSRLSGSRVEYVLPGEGDLPAKEVFEALRSISYAGYITLEWDKAWMDGLDDPYVVYTQFREFASMYEPTSYTDGALYTSVDGKGRYVWKHDELINENFPQVLDRMAETFPDQLCFKYTTLDYTRTYSQFRDDVDRCARAFIAVGVRPGSKVAVWATNLPAWYISFWAATKINATLVTMNTAYKIAEAEYLLRQSDTHTLIMINGYRDSDYVDTITRLCPEMEHSDPQKGLHCKKLPFLRNVITVGFRLKGCREWEEFLQESEKVPIEEVSRLSSLIKGDDVCNMQYTSGTTGFPKGVMLTHRGVVNNGKCIGDRMDLSTADRMMIQVPMFHCFGMVLAMTACMTHGTTMCPLPYFSPKPALDCITREKITCFHGVPTMFIAMLSHPDFAKTDFSHMRTGIMAGSNCPESVMREAADKMRMTGIVSVYGQTESSPGCTMSRCYDDSLDVRTTTVGSNLPQVECRIVDPVTGEELPCGQQGEFVARGYNVMKGYYKMPSATAQAIDKDGWLHTGDLCIKDPDGNYRVTGRLKDMIIRGGENIYPREIEEFLITHPLISDVQVIGVPDKQYGEEIMACVILNEGATLSEQEVKDYVLSSMARHKVPRYVWFMDKFIMNDAGKIQKFKMVEKACEVFKLSRE
ncbi:MAG: AMP-binding protein [Clostridia bacterium]|nr:AMP-binding protein [Clostridia bacterium]MBR6009179.1 AMP-binding protein [Clostridia bacterium]